MSDSLAHEFYKVRDDWEKIDKKKQWKLAIWVTEYADVEIVHGFMEIEQSPIGVFDDIFFKFESIFTSTIKEFEINLWNEFIAWFTPCPEEDYDMVTALQNDGFLEEAFVPNQELKPTLENLLLEIERFRQSINLEEVSFLFYFPPQMHDPFIGTWFARLLSQEIPEGVRFATIDLAKEPKLTDFSPTQEKLVAAIYPELNMVNALKNEMKKNVDAGNPHEPDTRYKKLVLELMEAVGEKKKSKAESFINKLLEISNNINQVGITTSTYLLIANAYFSLNQKDKGLDYANKAVKFAEELEKTEDTQAYPLWRSSMMIKAAFLFGLNKEDDALECYESMAKKATEQLDIFFIMESYRLAATIQQKRRKWQEAFEYACLALYAGSQLDPQIRVQSTFIFAGNIAYYCAKEFELPAKKEEILHGSLQEWLGDNWLEIIHGDVNLNQDYLNYTPEAIETEQEVKV